MTIKRSLIMISSRRRMMLLSMIILTLVSSAVAGSDPDWKLEIGMTKYIFLEREPIWLDITLFNTSSDTLRTWGLFPPCQGPSPFSIELKNEQGEHFKYTGPLYNMGPAKGPGLLLHSTEHLYGCYDIVELFSTFKGFLRQRFGLLPPGKYTVRGRYGSVHSQEIEFEVMGVSQEERQAFELLSRAYDLWLDPDCDTTSRVFDRVVGQFPNSVYAEKAMREVLPKTELMLRIPNSGYNELGLRMLISEFSKDTKTAFLEKIIQDHPDTRSARFAKRMLKWGQ